MCSSDLGPRAGTRAGKQRCLLRVWGEGWTRNTTNDYCGRQTLPKEMWEAYNLSEMTHALCAAAVEHYWGARGMSGAGVLRWPCLL